MAKCTPMYLCDLCPWRGDVFSDMMLHVAKYHYGTTYLFELTCLECNFHIGLAQSGTNHKELDTAMEYHLKYHNKAGSYSVERRTVVKPRRARRMRGAPAYLMNYIVW